MSARAPDRGVSLFGTLSRGLRGRCPRCGRGRLFDRRYRLRAACDECRLPLETLGADTWALMYLSTAGLTGVVVVAMLVIRPESLLVGRAVLATAATVAIVCSVPARKGAAVSLNYFIESRAGRPGPRDGASHDS